MRTYPCLGEKISCNLYAAGNASADIAAKPPGVCDAVEGVKKESEREGSGGNEMRRGVRGDKRIRDAMRRVDDAEGFRTGRGADGG